MTDDPKDLDRLLTAVFGNLDTRPDFNTRLMERVRSESLNDAARTALLATQHEQLRYGAAKRELLSWQWLVQSIAKVVTLDRIGIAALAAGAIATTWSPQELRQVLPEIVTAVGLLAALSPFAPAALHRFRATNSQA
jgi:hypothetical protein